MTTTTVNGIEFYYTVEGAGPSLLLVHGSWGMRTTGPRWSRNWRPGALSSRTTVAVIAAALARRRCTPCTTTSQTSQR